MEWVYLTKNWECGEIQLSGGVNRQTNKQQITNGVYYVLLCKIDGEYIEFMVENNDLTVLWEYVQDVLAGHYDGEIIVSVKRRDV